MEHVVTWAGTGRLHSQSSWLRTCLFILGGSLCLGALRALLHWQEGPFLARAQRKKGERASLHPVPTSPASWALPMPARRGPGKTATG